MANEHAHNPHEHFIVPTATYNKTILTLIVLMLATVLIAVGIQFPDVGPFSGTVLNQTVALVIACAKAFLVITIFMGVKWVTPLTRMWAMTGFVWFTLIFMILGDYVSRQYEPLNAWAPETGMGRVPEGNPNIGNPKPINPYEMNIHERD